MTRPPRIGIVGAGWWSTMAHVPALVDWDGADLVGVADQDPDRLLRVAEHFEVERTFSSHDQVLDAGVDGLVVSVPHAVHYPICRDALDAGVHVLVEKPMTLSAADAWDLVERAEEREVYLMVGYTAHFTDRARRARELVREGELGELLSVDGLFSSAAGALYVGRAQELEGVFPVVPPSHGTYDNVQISGGGQGQTQLTHLAGMAVWVTGRGAEEVWATMRDGESGLDVADAVACRMDRGVAGSLASTGSLSGDQPAMHELRYFGTEGLLVQDFGSGELHAWRRDGTVEHLPPLPPDEAYPRTAPARRLAELIRGIGSNPAPGEVGAQAVELIEAAYRSAQDGSVVRVGTGGRARRPDEEGT